MSYSKQEIKSGKFFKLEGGKPTDIHLLNDTPFAFSAHGYGKSAKECIGEECPECSKGEIPIQRWSTNIYDFTEKRVKVWTYSAAVARALKKHDEALQEEGKSIMDVDLRVLKEGEGTETTYTISTRMNRKEVPAEPKLYPLDIPF